MACGAVSGRLLELAILECFAPMALQARLHVELFAAVVVAGDTPMAIGTFYAGGIMNAVMEHHMFRQLGDHLPGLFRSLGQNFIQLFDAFTFG